MRLISFIRNDEPSYGAIDTRGVLDLGRHFGALAPDLKSFLRLGLQDQAKELFTNTVSRISLADLQLLPVIPNPGKIVCVGLNYKDHVAETQRQLTAHPSLFLRVPESQAAHEAPLLLPAETSQFDFEGEIAIIIGRGGRRIATSLAWEHVAGYACYNDGSARDWQAASGQWTAGKNFPQTGGFGPWMVTADEIPAGKELTLMTRLNGREMQRTTTTLMIHSIPEQIRHISSFTTLEPGDVIVTGTPGGVGFKRVPAIFLQSGDVVEVEVDGVGILRNQVVCEVATTEISNLTAEKAWARSG